MVNINTYSNEEMVRVQFCDNILFWIFSVVDHKSVTDAGLIDSFLANPSLLKSNFFLSEHSPNMVESRGFGWHEVGNDLNSIPIAYEHPKNIPKSK